MNLLLTKLVRDRPGKTSALGLCTDLAALGPYCQDLGLIFSQYGPRAWLIRYINLLLTEREGRTGEYWPEALTVRTEHREVRTKTTEHRFLNTMTFTHLQYCAQGCKL